MAVMAACDVCGEPASQVGSEVAYCNVCVQLSRLAAAPPDAPIPGVGGGNEGITTVCPTCGEKQAQPHMLASTYGPGPHLLYCSQRCSGEVWSER